VNLGRFRGREILEKNREERGELGIHTSSRRVGLIAD